MKCETFRELVGADPGTARPDVLDHARTCAACAQYRTEMIAVNGLIQRALRIEVETPRFVRPSAMNWRIAATILVGIMVFSLGWLAYPRTSLADQVVQHVLHESSQLHRTDARVDRDSVHRVLNRSGVYWTGADMPVSFAMVCPLGKHEVAHLVVQTGEGPVTVLVLPHERALSKPKKFEKQGFVGTFVPAPRGVVAVLARDGNIDAIAATALQALRYEAPSAVEQPNQWR